MSVDLKSDSAVQRWLSNYSEENRRAKLALFSGFYGYLQGLERFKDLSPSELVDFQKKASMNGDGFELLDALQDHIKGLRGTYSSLVTRYSIIKVFFKKNRAALPDDDFKINPNREPVAGRLTVDHIRSLISNASGPMRPFYLTLWMGLIDCERFRIFNEKCGGSLAKHLKEYGVDEPFMFEYSGRKQSRGKTRFYTFLGRDALSAWKEYFELRRGYPKDGEPLLIDRFGNKMSKEALRMGHMRLLEKFHFIDRGGDKSTRYGYNLHEFRDVSRTLLHLQGKGEGLDMECVEFWLGHTTDPNHYDKFYLDKNYVREQYRLAEKYLNIISGIQSTPSQDTKQLVEQIIKNPEAFKTLRDAMVDIVGAKLSPIEQKEKA